MNSKALDRICIVEPQKGPLSVKLIADKDLVIGLDAVVYAPDEKTQITHLKFGAQNGQETIRQIRVNELEINRHILTWQILCCAKSVSTTHGTILMEILQQNQACKLTIPILIKFSNIPPCSTQHYSRHTESLKFILKS